MPSTKLTLTLLACFWTGLVFAQDDIENLSVQTALEYAYQNNAQLNQVREALHQKEAEKRLIYGLNNPTLSYAKEGMNGNGFSEQRWAISQSLEFPTVMINQNSKVNREYEALSAAFEASKLELKSRVKSAYSRVAYTLEIVHLREEQVRLAREIENISLERNRVGESSRMDVLQAQLQLSEAQNNFKDAINALQVARYDLFNTIGLSPEDQSYAIDFPDTLAYVPVEFNQDVVLASIDQHPIITKDRNYVSAAESELKASRSRFLPSVSGSYFWQDFGNGFDFSGFEVGIRVPLWFAFDQAPRIGMSKASLRSSEFKLQEDILSLKMEAEQAWHSFDNVEQQIADYNESIRDRSTQLLSLTREAYRVGEIPLITLLEAQRTYLTSQERYLTALRDYYLHLTVIEKFLQKDLIYVD